MATSFRTLVYLAASMSLLTLGQASAQTTQARLTGRVTDGSGGALPGVTVTIASPNLSAPITVTTDGGGQYQSDVLPPDTYTVSFELSGFETRTNSNVVIRVGELSILDRELPLASVTETVQVTAPAPPAPAPPARLPPPPRPQARPVPREVLASVCGPRQPTDVNLAVGRIVSHRDDPKRELLGPGDILELSAGINQGVSNGQNLVVRRRFRVGDKGAPLKLAEYGEQTAGLIQVVEARSDSAVAVVVYLCGELFAGDAIEPFDPQPALSALSPGAPQFDEPAHIVLGENGQVVAAERQMMVIDRGIMQGVQRGQRLTIFRRPKGHQAVLTIGDGVIVSVRADSATIRIERATDAVTVGDMVALHR
ncbi:MAG: carboxypeptidase-like regulatory domain-containing protein [Vicinamibacterales bacterium]